jgi:hypothetical protein
LSKGNSFQLAGVKGTANHFAKVFLGLRYQQALRR